MDGISIAIAAVAGGLAAIIATLLVRNKGENKLTYGITFLLLFVGMRTLGQSYVYPKIYVLTSFKEVEASLLEHSVFQAMKQQEAGTYHSMLLEIKAAMKKGADQSSYMAIGRKHMMEVFKRRLPLASDESLAAYSDVMLQEMQELKAKGGEICHKVLFEQNTEINGLKYFSKATVDADLRAMADIINSKGQYISYALDEDSISRKLEPLFMDLAQEYGPDVMMLQNPNGKDVNKAKLCDMSIKLYSKINRLPLVERSGFLRNMWANGM